MKTELTVTVVIKYDHSDPNDMMDAARSIVDTIKFLDDSCAFTLISDDHGIIAEPEHIGVSVQRSNPDASTTRLVYRSFGKWGKLVGATK